MPASGRRVINQRTGGIVATSVTTATGAWGHFRGLMLQASLAEGAGLLFRPARGIHTHFMRFAIDLIFLDRDDTVTKVRHRMAPWRWDFSSAAAVIELNAGVAQRHDVRVGDRLHFEPAGGEVAPSATREQQDEARS